MGATPGTVVTCPYTHQPFVVAGYYVDVPRAYNTVSVEYRYPQAYRADRVRFSGK
jgi:hypothetical protein